MNRLLLIVALLAVVSVTLVPTYYSVLPHHADAAEPHAAQDDDCGCVCHASVTALVEVLTTEIHLTVTAVENSYSNFQPDALPSSLDRPPELFS